MNICKLLYNYSKGYWQKIEFLYEIEKKRIRKENW